MPAKQLAVEIIFIYLRLVTNLPHEKKDCCRKLENEQKP